MESDILISEKRKEVLKMKEILKGIAIATIVMAAIIMVQMGLTYIFSYHVGEVFSKVAITAVFYYYVIKTAQAVKKCKSVASAK